MIVNQTLSFKKAIKKLHKNQKVDLDNVVKDILDNPLLGQQKVGDLHEVKVIKFKMQAALTLLAYTWEEDSMTITLLKLSSHENFYRNLKR